MGEQFDRWWTERAGHPPESDAERKEYHRLHAAWQALAAIPIEDALELVNLRVPEVVVEVVACPDCQTVNRVRTAPVLVPVDEGPDGTPILGVTYPPSVLVCEKCGGLYLEDEWGDVITSWHEKAKVEDLKR